MKILWIHLCEVIACLLLASCMMPDGRVNRFNEHKVGTTYEVVSELLLLGLGTNDARLTIPNFDAIEKEFSIGSSACKKGVRVPVGTKLKIISIDRVGHWSWNTGTYYVHQVTVQILSGPYESQTLEGNILFIAPEHRSWDDRSQYIRELK